MIIISTIQVGNIFTFEEISLNAGSNDKSQMRHLHNKQ